MEWLVLILPLALLPLVFGFVGCGLEEQGGADTTIILNYPAGLPATVKELKVSYSLEHGGKGVQVSPQTLSQSEIDPNGGSVISWAADPLGSVVTNEELKCTCYCTVTLTSGVDASPPPLLKSSPEDSPLEFQLKKTSTGSFTLF